MAKPPAYTPTYTPVTSQPSSLTPPIPGPSASSSSSTTGASYSIDLFGDSFGSCINRFIAWLGLCPCIIFWNTLPCCSNSDFNESRDCRMNRKTSCNGACRPCGHMFDTLGMLARDVCTCAGCKGWRKTILEGLVVLGLIWWDWEGYVLGGACVRKS